MLNCANDVFETEKSLKEQYASKGDIQKYWMLHYRRKAICKNKRAEQVSGEPFSLLQQHRVNRITEHKKESFRNWSVYLLLSERLWYMWGFLDESFAPPSPLFICRAQGRGGRAGFWKDGWLTCSVLAVQVLAVCALSPLGDLIQRPVKSLGASPLTSISFESSFAFSLSAWLFSYLLASV